MYTYSSIRIHIHVCMCRVSGVAKNFKPRKCILVYIWYAYIECLVAYTYAATLVRAVLFLLPFPLPRCICTQVAYACIEFLAASTHTPTLIHAFLFSLLRSLAVPLPCYICI